MGKGNLSVGEEEIKVTKRKREGAEKDKVSGVVEEGGVSEGGGGGGGGV